VSVKRARLLELGLKPYREVLALQRTLHARVAAGEERDTWILVEHEPVVTLGRSAKREHVLASPELLAASGIEVVECERGGDVTYHGPGQVVVYPIARLERFREVVPLVSALEDAALACCARFGVGAERWSEHRGIYAGNNQIAAVGLAVKHMTSLHGIALNAATELNYERLIAPCGLAGRGVTSLSRETGRHVAFDEAAEVLLEELSTRFGVAFEREALVSA
jgi:lipoate-protein ligase B